MYNPCVSRTQKNPLINAGLLREPLHFSSFILSSSSSHCDTGGRKALKALDSPPVSPIIRFILYPISVLSLLTTTFFCPQAWRFRLSNILSNQRQQATFSHLPSSTSQHGLFHTCTPQRRLSCSCTHRSSAERCLSNCANDIKTRQHLQQRRGPPDQRANGRHNYPDPSRIRSSTT